MSAKAISKGITFNGLSLTLGIICAFIKIVSVVMSGSPFDMIHKLDPNGIIPSFWLWNICGIILYFLAGNAAGIVINDVSKRSNCGPIAIYGYKGGMFFVALFFLGILHHPLFFICERLLTSLIVAVAACVCAVMCAVFWTKISSAATVIMISFAFYSLYITLINICILVSN